MSMVPRSENPEPMRIGGGGRRRRDRVGEQLRGLGYILKAVLTRHAKKVK